MNWRTDESPVYCICLRLVALLALVGRVASCRCHTPSIVHVPDARQAFEIGRGLPLQTRAARMHQSRSATPPTDNTTFTRVDRIGFDDDEYRHVRHAIVHTTVNSRPTHRTKHVGQPTSPWMRMSRRSSTPSSSTASYSYAVTFYGYSVSGPAVAS
jgi:hypothetical protein